MPRSSLAECLPHQAKLPASPNVGHGCWVGPDVACWTSFRVVRTAGVDPQHHLGSIHRRTMALCDEANVRLMANSGRCFRRLGVAMIVSTRHIRDRMRNNHKLTLGNLCADNCRRVRVLRLNHHHISMYMTYQYSDMSTRRTQTCSGGNEGFRL